MSDKIRPDELRRLLKSIRRIARASDLQSHALRQTSGLTGPQLVLLMALGEFTELTTKALADHADLSSATVVTVLDNLEQRGLVSRRRSQTDRRIVHTRLTEAGQALMTNAPDLFGPRFAQRFGALTPPKRAALLGAIAELADLMAQPDMLPAEPATG